MRNALLLVLIAVFFSACQPPAANNTSDSSTAKRYPFVGKVVSVNRAAKKATISHEDIPGYMSAMTMEFPIHEDWVWNDLTPGSEIHAELVVENAAKDPFWLEKIGIVAAADPNQTPTPDPTLGKQIPDFALTNQDGKKISPKDFRGRAWAITFIYARCPLRDYCIRMSTNFSDLANSLKDNDELKDKVRLLSISFDPENDTPTKLRQYGQGYLGNRANPDFTIWQLAVGSDAEVKKIAAFFGLDYTVDENNKTQIIHNLRTAVISPDGTVTKVFSGNEWTPAAAFEGIKRDSLAKMRIKSFILCLMLIALGSNVQAQIPTQTPAKQSKLVERDPELQHFLERLGSNQNRLSSEMWTLVHAYDSKEEVDRVLNYFIDFFKAVDSDDETKYEKLGGIKGFKEQFSKFLDSKDEAVKSFALFVAGVSGDKTFVPKIVKFVNERDPSFYDRFADHSVFYRGRAAIALGKLTAQEFKPDVAKLLESKNKSDRSGAIFALADLNGIEYTDQIVNILTNKDLKYDDDDSPIYFLMQTGQAHKFKKEIAATMAGEFMRETAETAAYALTAMDAKEFASTISNSLNNKFRRSWAAKALALMQATEYSDKIALLLKDGSILVRAAAATSLGILHSRKHIPDLARVLLTDKDGSVRHDAAEALRLEASQHYENALKELDGAQIGKDYSITNYHEFVRDKVQALNAELEKKISIAKATTKIQP